MRLSLITGLTTGIALLSAAPVLADTYQASADITGVTIYPQGASVTRQVTVDVTAGAHEVIVPGFPQNTDANGLRVMPRAGVRIGAVSLAKGRQPVTPENDTPQVIACFKKLPTSCIAVSVRTM